MSGNLEDTQKMNEDRSSIGLCADDVSHSFLKEDGPHASLTLTTTYKAN